MWERGHGRESEGARAREKGREEKMGKSCGADLCYVNILVNKSCQFTCECVLSACMCVVWCCSIPEMSHVIMR